jgi:hypothetical protein
MIQKICKFNIKNSVLTEINDVNFKTNKMCSNGKYICIVKSLDVYIFR